MSPHSSSSIYSTLIALDHHIDVTLTKLYCSDWWALLNCNETYRDMRYELVYFYNYITLLFVVGVHLQTSFKGYSTVHINLYGDIIELPEGL